LIVNWELLLTYWLRTVGVITDEPRAFTEKTVRCPPGGAVSIQHARETVAIGGFVVGAIGALTTLIALAIARAGGQLQ
jgi:hypothetical protein